MNDHHGHLEGSLGYPRPPTLPQNSIGSLRGDVRPDLCQSGLSTLPVRSVATIRVCLSQNSPNPTHQRSNPTLEGPIPPLGTSWEEHPDPGKAKSSRFTLHERWPNALLLFLGKEQSS
ncbi:hypothetical protein CDL15_Pgr011638 [Punica granatum]|uniref:Uncharacterized protein n=1 Tax=Punica granatum TaxID=22663 RepID=A0A218XH44_PUNGR|nr:hypothetical protein CDL15_Pgr011638 [Punica granatum]